MRTVDAHHDPKRFYHCDCLDLGGGIHDEGRFYHCTCVEEGYCEEGDRAEKAEARVRDFVAAVERMREGRLKGISILFTDALDELERLADMHK